MIKSKDSKGVEVHKIRVSLRSFDHALVDKSIVSIIKVIKDFGCKVSGPVLLPVKISKYTVLRSVHIHKKSREQFEMRVHKRMIDIYEPNKEVLDALIKLEIPVGVDVSVKDS